MDTLGDRPVQDRQRKIEVKRLHVFADRLPIVRERGFKLRRMVVPDLAGRGVARPQKRAQGVGRLKKLRPVDRPGRCRYR